MPPKLLPYCYGLKQKILTFLHVSVIAGHRIRKISSQVESRYFSLPVVMSVSRYHVKKIISPHYHIFHINSYYLYSFFIVFILYFFVTIEAAFFSAMMLVALKMNRTLSFFISKLAVLPICLIPCLVRYKPVMLQEIFGTDSI